MDDSNKNMFNALNKIKFSIDEKSQKKWAAEAALQCFRKEIEKLDIKMDYLKKDIARIEVDIEDLTPQMNIMEEQHRIVKDTFRTSQASILHQSIHVECVKESVQKHKEEGDKILEHYSQQLQKCRIRLEEDSPTFKILKEKRIELQKLQFSIKMLRFKLKQQKWIDKKKLEVQQQIFYKDCVTLATVWLAKKKYDESLRNFDKLKAEEAELIKKLMDLKKQTKEKQKINNAKKMDQNRKETDNALGKLMSETPASSKKDHHSIKSMCKNSLECINSLFSKQTYTNAFQRNQITPNAWQNSNYLANNQFVTAPSKIQILENKILKSKNESELKTVQSMSKEEKSKALGVKLQKVMQNCKAKYASQRSRSQSQSFILREKAKFISEKKTTGAATSSLAPPATTTSDTNQNLNNDNAGASQESENAIYFSQDNPIVDMISQESGKSVQVKLDEFKYETVENRKVSDNRFVGQNERQPHFGPNKNNTSQNFTFNNGSQLQKNRTIHGNVPFSTASAQNVSSVDQMMPEKRYTHQNGVTSQFVVNNNNTSQHFAAIGSMITNDSNAGRNVPFSTVSAIGNGASTDQIMPEKRLNNQNEVAAQYFRNNMNTTRHHFNFNGSKAANGNDFKRNVPFSTASVNNKLSSTDQVMPPEKRFTNQNENTPQPAANNSNTSKHFTVNSSKVAVDINAPITGVPGLHQSLYKFPVPANADTPSSGKNVCNMNEKGAQNVANNMTNVGSTTEDKFNMNMPFSMGQSGGHFVQQPHQEKGNFAQNVNINNPFKRQKVEENQHQESMMDTSILNTSLDMRNYETELSQQLDEDKMLKLTESQYNFGNVTGFMQSPLMDVQVIAHGWMFRPEAGLHQGVVQELVEALESGDIRSVRALLDAGWRLEASQAVYTYLNRLEDPLIPLTIQSLVLDDNDDVPIELVASDVLGLLRQELPENHLQLIAVLLHLLDIVIKCSPADELRGNTLPISMLPIFFNIQTQHINDWRRIATIFVEMIRQASDYLEVTLDNEECVSMFFKERRLVPLVCGIIKNRVLFRKYGLFTVFPVYRVFHS